MLHLKALHEVRLFLRVTKAWSLAAAGLLLCAQSSWANDPRDDSWRASTSLYGKPGIVEMPNALFHGTGEISLTGMIKDPDNRITFNFQPLPWFEGSFRYSVIEGFFPLTPESPDLFDRSFDFKIKVLDQGAYYPAVAIGAQDIAGTGIFSAEYVVATWQTDNFNFTGGLGFGRFASRGELTNPLALAFDRAKTRDSFSGDILDTGRVRFGQYFQGEDMGVFGGIEYFTPIEGLKLAVEYSSDAYTIEQSLGISDPQSPINVGLSYRVNDSVELGAAYINGEAFAFRLTIQTNPLKATGEPARLDPEPFLYETRQDSQTTQTPMPASQSANYYDYRSRVIMAEYAKEADTQLEDRDYLSADNVWDPWEPEAVGDTRYLASLGRDGDAYEGDQDNLMVAGAMQPGGLSASEGEPSSDPVFDNKNNNSPSLFKALHSSDPGLDAEPISYQDYPVPTFSLEDQRGIADQIRRAGNVQKIGIRSAGIVGQTLEVHYYNYKYHREAEAIGRLLPIMSQVAPDSIEVFTLVATARDLSLTRIEIPRGALERIVENGGSPQELFNVATLSPGETQRPRQQGISTQERPRLTYGLHPQFRYSLFDPDDPMRYGFTLSLRGNLELIDGLTVSGSYQYSLYDNFDEIDRGADSVLPHVRTDFAQYLNASEHGLQQLTLTYRWKASPNVYLRHYVGYFEDMYGGVGSEVLYAPFGKRWAVALEANHVRKRDFDRGFGFQDYEVTTGFAKFYYQSDYEDLRFEVDAGRYLAGDYGATFKVFRTFDNGMEIGAFATFTDVPFEDFGEGSFDKGITFRIPFHALSLYDTKSRYAVDIKPLTRDGGAQLWSGEPLYDLVSPYSFQNIVRTWKAVFRRRD